MEYDTNDTSRTRNGTIKRCIRRNETSHWIWCYGRFRGFWKFGELNDFSSYLFVSEDEVGFTITKVLNSKIFSS